MHVVHLSEVSAVVAEELDIDENAALNLILTRIGLPGEDVGLYGTEVEDALYDMDPEAPQGSEDWAFEDYEMPEDVYETRAAIEAALR